MADIRMASKKAEDKPNKVHELRIRKADNGGHIVDHMYENNGMNYKQPDQHVFGDGEGDKALAHVGDWMGVPNSS